MAFGRETQDGLKKLEQRNDPMLKAARANEALNRKLASAGAVSFSFPDNEETTQFPGTHPRLYMDGKLISSGNTTTFSPTEGKKLSLYGDESGWQDHTLESDITNSAAGAVSGKKYDHFVYFDPATDAYILDKVAWTDDTTRSVALDTQDGALLLSTDHTWRYVGWGSYNGTSMQVASGDGTGMTWYGTGDPNDPTGSDPFTGMILNASGLYGYDVGVLQTSANNLGKILAGGGAVILDADGQLINLDGVEMEFNHSEGRGYVELIEDTGLSIVSAEIESGLTVVDGDCEDTTMGLWTIVSGTPSKSTSIFHDGTRSIDLNGATIRSQNNITRARSGCVLSFWAYVPDTKQISFSVKHFSGGGAVTGLADQIIYLFVGSDATPTWKKYAIWAEYSSADNIRVEFFGSAGVYIDDISLEEGEGYQSGLEPWHGSPGSVLQQTGSLHQQGNIAADGTLAGSNFSGSSSGANTGDLSIGAQASGASLAGQVFSLAPDGWTEAGLTWTYASASTFTITGDYTAVYKKGTLIKFTQTTVKYAVVSTNSTFGGGNTTVTIIVNTDYVIANAAISVNYYSYGSSPLGWPMWFNRSAVGIVTGATGTVGAYAQTVEVCKYRVIGLSMREKIGIKVTNVGSWTSTVQIASVVPQAGSDTLSAGWQGSVSANAALAPKGYAVLRGGSVIAFIATVNTTLLAWAAMAANDFLLIETEYQW